MFDHGNIEIGRIAYNASRAFERCLASHMQAVVSFATECPDEAARRPVAPPVARHEVRAASGKDRVGKRDAAVIRAEPDGTLATVPEHVERSWLRLDAFTEYLRRRRDKAGVGRVQSGASQLICVFFNSDMRSKPVSVAGSMPSEVR